jgi:hypothetical protein
MSRPCSVCISGPDRKGIDQYILEGRPLSEISVQFNISIPTIRRHRDNGHISRDVANRVSKSSRLTMDSLLSSVQLSVERATKRAISAPIQYYAQTERTAIEGNKFIGSVIVKAKELELAQSKLQQSKALDPAKLMADTVDYLRRYHPESVERYLVEVWNDHDTVDGRAHGSTDSQEGSKHSSPAPPLDV